MSVGAVRNFCIEYSNGVATLRYRNTIMCNDTEISVPFILLIV